MHVFVLMTGSGGAVLFEADVVKCVATKCIVMERCRQRCPKPCHIHLSIFTLFSLPFLILLDDVNANPNKRQRQPALLGDHPPEYGKALSHTRGDQENTDLIPACPSSLHFDPVTNQHAQ